MAEDGIRERENVPPSSLGSDPLGPREKSGLLTDAYIILECQQAWHEARTDDSDKTCSGGWRSKSSIIRPSKRCW